MDLRISDPMCFLTVNMFTMLIWPHARNKPELGLRLLLRGVNAAGVSVCSVLPLRQRKVRKSSVLGLRLDRSWMEEDSEEEESDERDEEEGTAAGPAPRPPGSATLTGVVLGELGCDWANFLWAWSRGLKGRRGLFSGCDFRFFFLCVSVCQRGRGSEGNIKEQDVRERERRTYFTHHLPHTHSHLGVSSHSHTHSRKNVCTYTNHESLTETV